MRVLTRNLLEEADSLTMTNPNADYPIEQIYSNMLEERLQASDITTTITAIYTNDQIVDAVYFGYHNVSSFVVTLKDSGDSIIESIEQTYPSQRSKIYFSVQRTNVRKIEIILTNAATDVFVGGVTIGAYTQLYNIGKPINIRYKSTSAFEQTDGGQILHRTGRRFANFDILMNKVTEEQHDNFMTAYDYVLTGKTFWLDRHEDLITRLPIFGIFDTEIATSEHNEFIDISTSFLEGR